MEPETHTIESGLAAATAALAAGMSGTPAPVEPAPAPPTSTPTAPAPQPTPVPAAAAPAPPAAPVAMPTPATPSATPAPPAATEITDPAARRFVEMNRGDVQAALAKALRDNNRLGAIAREHPELFRAGGIADPTQPLPQPTEAQLFEDPPPVTPSLPTVQVDENAIRATVDQAVLQDPEASSLVRSYITNQQQLAQMGAERNQHEQRIAYVNQLLTDERALPADDLRRGDYQNELDRLDRKVASIEARESRLQMNNDRLSAMFDNRKALIANYHLGQARQQAEETAYAAYEREVEQTEYRKTQVEWPSALDRCIKDNNIPAEQVADFVADAKRAVLAELGDPSKSIPDMYAFLAPVAKQISERLDRYHRVRAGQYATGAAMRAATPSPPTGPGSPVPSNAPPTTPEEAMNQATRMWRQRSRA